MSRRKVLTKAGVALGGSVAAGISVKARGQAAAAEPKGSFVMCLNTSTIMGQKLTIEREIEIAAECGYTAIEPWIREIEDYQKRGGKLPDLKKRFSDAGLSVEDTIGFAPWIVDDAAERKKGLEQAKREMDLSVQIGAKRMAAPPAGAQNAAITNLPAIAERYRALCDLGDQMGIVAMVEVWGFSKTLHLLSDAAYVAIQSGHPKACILTDVYHLYKGGNDPATLKLLSRHAMQMMHFNDYPADPPRSKISDEHRIFPGDGIAPITQILKDVRDMGGQCVLSLELFNRQYWKLDPVVCAKTGIEKMKAAVARAAT